MASENIGLEKAAIFLMSLSKPEAAEILRHMGPREVQRVGQAMATLRNVPQERFENVMEEFFDVAKSHTPIGVGSDEHIRELLTAALGEHKAGGVIDKILIGADAQGLDTLRWMDARSVADIIRGEHPQIQTILLSYLEPEQAAEILGFFDPKQQIDIMMRISTQESIQPAALNELNEIMSSQFSGGASGQSRQVGGIKVAADIMNNLDSGIEAQIMEGVKERDSDIGQEIQDLMFVFENLMDVDDRGIQTLLREISSDVLILALKGADGAMREKIFTNMSKRAAELLRDDLEAKGPVRVSEVEGAQKEIINTARRLADSGEIMLGGKGGEEMI